MGTLLATPYRGEAPSEELPRCPRCFQELPNDRCAGCRQKRLGVARRYLVGAPLILLYFEAAEAFNRMAFRWFAPPFRSLQAFALTALVFGLPCGVVIGFLRQRILRNYD
jgi:hypothetical protein